MSRVQQLFDLKVLKIKKQISQIPLEGFSQTSTMEEKGIEAVLAKATELRFKISNCVQNTNSQEEEEDKESQRLLHIHDALESLENQLSNLQDLQQQQQYDRQVALVEIEHSRKFLLDKLNDYRGEHLGVIQEALVFAAETVEHESDLLLPPYPSRPFQSMQFPSTIKTMSNRIMKREIKDMNMNPSGGNQAEAISKPCTGGLGRIVGIAAKTIITLVGVMSVVSVIGLGPSLGDKKYLPFRISGLVSQQPTEEDKQIVKCQNGRVLVVEDGEARCIVKEKIAVPFDSRVVKPDLNYGSG